MCKSELKKIRLLYINSVGIEPGTVDCKPNALSVVPLKHIYKLTCVDDPRHTNDKKFA